MLLPNTKTQKRGDLQNKSNATLSYSCFAKSGVALIFLCFFCCLFPSCQPNSSFYLGGIQVNEPDMHHWTKSLKNVGMNTVSVTVYARQGDWNSDHIWYDDLDKGVLAEIAVAKQNGLKVVLIPRVALDHAFERNQFYWHGMIYPKSEKDLTSWFEKYTAFLQKWAAIAQQYKVDVFAIGSEMNLLTATDSIDAFPNLINYYLDSLKQIERREELVQVAQQIDEKHLWVRGLNKNLESVDRYAREEIEQQANWAKQVSFLVENKDTVALTLINQRRALLEKHWIQLIQTIRKTYKGKLTYAANFDNYQDVGFWQHLDMMGINAYFPLREQLDATLNRQSIKQLFQTKWTETIAAIDTFRHRSNISNLPVLFTELGYTFRQHSTIQPWAGSGFSVLHPSKDLVIWEEEAINYQERQLAIQALLDVCKAQEQAFLTGILYWKLSTNINHKEVEPFVLHIQQPPTDSLQVVLRGFLELR